MSYDNWLEKPYIDRAKEEAEMEKLQDYWMHESLVVELWQVLPPDKQDELQGLVDFAAERQLEETR